MQAQAAGAAVLLAVQHAIAHQHPVGLPVVDAAHQVRVACRIRAHGLLPEGLDGAELKAQVPQLGFAGEDVVFEVADFLLEVEDPGGGGFGAVDEEGVEMLGTC